MKTAWEITQRIENWPTPFRDGLNVVCRGGNVDWTVLHISLELQGDPQGARTRQNYWEPMDNLGFTIEEEEVCSLFLHR